jgi:hypothetical protein
LAAAPSLAQLGFRIRNDHIGTLVDAVDAMRFARQELMVAHFQR